MLGSKPEKNDGHRNFYALRNPLCTHFSVGGSSDEQLPGLPWGWHFNPHTHPIPTRIPIGIPMGIPIPTGALTATHLLTPADRIS